MASMLERMVTNGEMKTWRSLRVFAVVILCLWGIVESGYGLFQVLGWRNSRHALFALTGHFQNPGPFGGFIACVMAVAGAWVMGLSRHAGLRSGISSLVSVIAWVALGMGLLVLPASMSRAGWLGLAVALGVEALRETRIREWLKKRHWAIPVGCTVFIALLVGAFLLKPDSALGRLHVWWMECWAIAERPWSGAGPGMGPWAYGEAQEAFFREHLETVSAATIRVAGCPDYAYNEYLGIGVEYGLPVMVLFVLMVVSSIVALHKAGSPLAAGLTAWAVFAFASYPLAVVQLRILGTVFMVAAVVAGALQAAGSCRSARFDRGTACRLFAALIPLVSALLLVLWMKIPGQARDDGREARVVYAEGYTLHQAGRYAESTRLLEKGARMSCDPMFEIIMGKNAEALGDCEQAAALYEKAHYRVPSRLYPLVRLMRLQVRQGRDEEAEETARQIVAMPVNGRNAGMVRLHEETQKTLDSLIVVTRR